MNRYQKFSEREYVMEHHLSEDFIKSIHYAKMNINQRAGVSWKGASLSKDPMSLCIYNQLLQELKPRTIIEIGAWEGASAKWFHDTLKSLDVDCKIYSYDINLDKIKIEQTDGINFDIMNSEKIASTMKLPGKIERPLLFIEDAHINVYGVLEFMSPVIREGDYVIVEDTMKTVAIDGVYSDLEKFMLENSDDYSVDSYYTDMFGYNMTWHCNGIFRKMR